MNKQTVQIFFTLLWRDIRIFNPRFIGRSIDSLAWISSVVIVAHYIMPMFGLSYQKFGTFTLIGTIAVWGLFEMMTNIAVLIGDFEGNQSISYFLTLPIPQYMIFVEYGLASAYRSIATSIFILPVGKIILGSELQLTHINWPQFIFAMLSINLFYGFFTLFLASKTPNLNFLGTIRTRFMFPLWFLGGYQFTWKMLYAKSKILAYANLLNPITYIMDGIRATVLDPNHFIPFWTCMIVLWSFSILFGWIGTKRLLTRLDCL